MQASLCVRIHVSLYMCEHSCMHVLRIHSCVNALLDTCMKSCMHSSVYPHAFMQLFICACINVGIRVCIHSCMQLVICVQLFIDIYTCINVRSHAWMHPCINAYAHITAQCSILNKQNNPCIFPLEHAHKWPQCYYLLKCCKIITPLPLPLHPPSDAYLFI